MKQDLVRETAQPGANWGNRISTIAGFVRGTTVSFQCRDERSSALKKMSAWLMLRLYGPRLCGSSTRTFIGISDALRRNSLRRRAAWRQEPRSGCCHVFGLVIGDQIGKLINTAGMKLPCPVGASASNSANSRGHCEQERRQGSARMLMADRRTRWDA